jgi:hypothetical protein
MDKIKEAINSNTTIMGILASLWLANDNGNRKIILKRQFPNLLA